MSTPKGTPDRHCRWQRVRTAPGKRGRPGPPWGLHVLCIPRAGLRPIVTRILGGTAERRPNRGTKLGAVSEKRLGGEGLISFCAKRLPEEAK